MYGLHLEYGTGGEGIGGEMVALSPAMDRAVPKGEKLVFRLTPEDFPGGGDLSRFNMELYVVLAEQTEAPAGRLDFSAEYGGVYEYVLTGGGEGFALEQPRRKGEQ